MQPLLGSLSTQTQPILSCRFATTANVKAIEVANNEITHAMTEAASSDVAKDVAALSQPPHSHTDSTEDALMPDVKTEDTSDSRAHLVESVAERPVKETDEQDAAGDSEAETLIQSPEKAKNIIANAPTLHPTGSASVKNTREDREVGGDSSSKTRKRKRTVPEERRPASEASSSSPLSSPNPQAHSRESDSDASDTPRSARSQRTRRSGPKGELEGGDGAPPSKSRRRRPSDIIPPPAKNRVKGSSSAGDGTSDRRETRSATYPRQSSEDRSPSPRPISRGQHRRGVSTQLTSGEFERKKRGRPPNISTKRNVSLDRAQSSFSDGESSPPVARPSLEKYDSRDHMSPAKPSGPRKWRDKNGRTFLSRACNNEDLDKVKQCYNDRPEDVNLPDNAGNTPLQIASLEGFASIVEFLLGNGAEVDTRNIDKETPLIDAVENGHLEVVKLLLKFGANPRLSNSRGDEPYELVPQDDENYKVIRKLIADAKDDDFTTRRKSSDNNNDGNREGSSRAASAASPRDSPPILGPRSPPAHTSRRRTGRSESTRNDLLWQSHTQENLRSLAAKGNVQGVATILNVLQKAEPAAVIAAAKAGHEEVLQYLLAMGAVDPDPDPLPDLKVGYNTPMLAAIGRGNLDVIKLLVEQTGFNPSRRYKGKAYHDIAQERKGDSWTREVEILKDAYDKHMSGKPKTKSPKKVREPVDRVREKRVRRSESPPSSNLRTSSSPTITHKSLPDKSPRSARKDSRKEMSPPPERERGQLNAMKDDTSIAIASDQEQTVSDKRGHKHRRSQSDLPLSPNLEAEITQRRRRLVTGKEHRRSQSGVAGAHSEGSASEPEIKRERPTPGLKRNRNSLSPEPKDSGTHRGVLKKRRTVLESSPEEARPAPRSKEMTTADTPMLENPSENAATKRPRSDSPDTTTQDAPGEPDETLDVVNQAGDVSASVEASKPEDPAEEQRRQEQKIAEQKEAEERALEEQRKTEEEKVAAERAAAEKAAAEEAEAARLAAERAAAEQAEIQRRAAEAAAEAKREAEAAEARRKSQEAEAKKQAEEEAAARKKEEEERQEQQRRELEERQRRQEQRIRQQHLEIERRRRESLPASLCRAALLLQAGSLEAKSHEWLSHFLPLYTVRTSQLDPSARPAVANEEWIPNFQAAVLLATNDLNLRNYTSIEKRPASLEEQERLWKVGRHMLSYEYQTTSYNTSIKKAKQIEAEQRPKFMSMTEVFWVKVREDPAPCQIPR